MVLICQLFSYLQAGCTAFCLKQNSWCFDSVMANPVIGKEHSSKSKKVLNNSNPDLASIMAHTSAQIQVLLLKAILTTYVTLWLDFMVLGSPVFQWRNFVCKMQYTRQGYTKGN